MRVPPSRSSPRRKGRRGGSMKPGTTISPAETRSRMTISAILRPTFSSMALAQRVRGCGELHGSDPDGLRSLAGRRHADLGPAGAAVALLFRLRLGIRLALVQLARALAQELAHARLLADALAQEVELRAAHVAAPHDLDVLDARRVQREDPLDALALHQAAHDQVARDAAAPDRDHGAGE